jgi:hypothetical protein
MIGFFKEIVKGLLSPAPPPPRRPVAEKFTLDEPDLEPHLAPPQAQTLTGSTPDLDLLISRLSYIHKETAYQAAKRAEAYQQLAALGIAARPAIPRLIEKHFTASREEVGLARQTLPAVDPEWYRHELAHTKIDFLIKQLEKDQVVANRALKLLALIGPPACAAAKEVLERGAAADGYLRLNALKLLAECKPLDETLLPILDAIINSDEHADLLEKAAQTLSRFEALPGETAAYLIGLMGHKVHAVRAAAVTALGRVRVIDEGVIAPLLNALYDDFELVRDNSIAVLSQLEHSAASAFYQRIIESRGEMSREDFQKLFEKIAHWSRGEVKSFQYDPNQFWDNLSWYNLELRKNFDKPGILLSAVLQILSNQAKPRPELAEPLLAICEQSSKKEVLLPAIDLLSRDQENQTAAIACLLGKLNAPAVEVRAASRAALAKIDPQWLQRPDAIELIDRLIEQLDTSSYQLSKAALVELGAPVLPVLLQKLEESKNGIYQRSIIAVLDSLGEQVQPVLPALQQLREKCADTRAANALDELLRKLKWMDAG